MTSITFEDYHACPDTAIIDITAEGIRMENGDLIVFADCAANFTAIHGGSGKCVGKRDITGSAPSISFYTAPLTTHIFFTARGLLGKNMALRRFRTMQKLIESFGYTTYDVS